MKKIISLLLALVLALSIIPMAAMAVEEADLGMFDEIIRTEDGKFYGHVFETPSGIKEYYVPLEGAQLEAAEKLYNEWLASQNTYHEHKFGLEITRSGHYYSCDCGARTAIVPHIDPTNAVNGRCTCGYKFMDNATLTVLWINDVRLTTRFNPETTEYEAKTVSYKDVTELKINAKAFDDMATVELPEDLTIKEGSNKIEIKVTAEDGKTTKTYTVNIVKE